MMPLRGREYRGGITKAAPAGKLGQLARHLARPGRGSAAIPALALIFSGLILHESLFAAPSANEPPAQVKTQIGHAGLISAVVFSPDGRLALSGSADRELKLWEVASGRELRSFTGHTSGITSLAFSPDGRLALSGGDFALRLWEVASGRELKSFSGHRLWVAGVAFSPDGRLALSGSADSTLKLWEIASGRQVRSFTGHAGPVNSVAFSPDGKLALSGSSDKTLKLWEVASGRELRSFTGHGLAVTNVAFAPDGRLALSGSEDKSLKLWEVESGRELRSFTGHTGKITSAAFSTNGRLVLSGSLDYTLKLWDAASGQELKTIKGYFGSSVTFSPSGQRALLGSHDQALKLLDLTSGRELRSFAGHARGVTSVAFSPNGQLVLSLSQDDHALKIWEVASGRELRSFRGDASGSVAFSPDGQLALSGNYYNLQLWDVASWRVVKSLTGHTRGITSVAFSPDGRLALSGSYDNTLRLWDVATGREARTFTGHTNHVHSVAFSPDGRLVLSGSRDRTLKLWDVASGRELRSFTGHTNDVNAVAFSPDGRLALSGGSDLTLKLWEVATGRALRSFPSRSLILSVAFSPDGRLALSGNIDFTVQLWDVATRRELRSFTGHSSRVNSVAFSPDGKRIISGSTDGTIRVWDTRSGEELAAMIASADGSQLAITPKGFFTASQRDTGMVTIVRGLEATSMSQVHQSLYNPDLVREALAGDPDGEVKRAAEVINLEKVLDSGPAPVAEIISQSLESKSDADLVAVTARIKDQGQGVGRIEFRVNDITTAVRPVPAGPGPLYELRQDLALEPGENTVEVIAYNRRNLLASLPAKTAITYTGRAGSVKPKLHILAIGINTYHDQGWTPPGASQAEYFPPLALAAGDATRFAAEMKKAASGLYSDVRIRTALSEEAQSAKLDRIVQEMSAEIGPRDTFVLYAAAHGYSHEGRFYLIPQDYQGGSDPQALAARAIGQERLQDWVANRIKAKRALILLDTCESGALTHGYTHSRIDAPASEAALGRLHEATGRPVLTAAAAGKPAFEGYQGHGVFTWAVIDALYHGDSNGDGVIQLSELVAHVQNAVPKISGELNGMGRAAIAVRGFGDDRQTAHFGAAGGDFALVKRLE
jgi:WD40 repeat protein